MTAWMLALGLFAAAEAKRPNVVFVLADDLGYSDLGCYGGEIDTPNLNGLAANGVRFTNFCNTARCWPSRAALLTGYYPQQVNRDPMGQRPKWAALLPQLLEPAGYRSYHTGKWHVDGPILAGGFQHAYDIADQDRFHGPKKLTRDDQAIEPGRGYYVTTAVADTGVEWLKEHQTKHAGTPFFLYVAFTSPHFPLHAKEEDIAKQRPRYAAGWDAVREARVQRLRKLGLYDGPVHAAEPDVYPPWNTKAEKIAEAIDPDEVGRAVPWASLTPKQQAFQAEKMALHAAMVDRMDQEIGKLLAQLRAMNAMDDTLVMFASDNGASAEMMVRGDGHDRTKPPGSAGTFLCLGPGWSTAANAPFRKHKHWTHEGGVSTPLIAHWPKGIAAKGELRRAPGHLIDIVPTVLELAGTAAPAEFAGAKRPPLPGKSLLPAFAADVPIPREGIFFKHQGHRGYRSGDWKIVSSAPENIWELYDLSKDRGETTNLAQRHPERVAELAAKWTALDAEYAKQGAEGKPLPGAGKGGKKKKA